MHYNFVMIIQNMKKQTTLIRSFVSTNLLINFCESTNWKVFKRKTLAKMQSFPKFNLHDSFSNCSQVYANVYVKQLSQKKIIFIQNKFLLMIIINVSWDKVLWKLTQNCEMIACKVYPINLSLQKIMKMANKTTKTNLTGYGYG